MSKQIQKQPEYLTTDDLWECFIGSADFATEMDGISVFDDGAIYEDFNEKRKLLPYLDKTESMGISAVLEKPGQYWRVHSILPALEGIDAHVTFGNNVYVPEDGYGFMTFSIDGMNKHPLTARNPFFMANRNFIEKDTKATIKLAALCLKIDKMPVKVSSSAFLPGAREDLYKFQTDVLSVQRLEFLGQLFYRLEIEPIRNARTGKSQKLYLYAAKEILGKYIPRTGDNIQGFLALFGYVDKVSNKPFDFKSWKNVTADAVLKQIKNGADVNMRTTWGPRPLSCAIINGSDDSVIKLLLKYGANFSCLTGGVYSLITKKWLLDKMIEAGISLNVLLRIYSTAGNLSFVQHLIKHKAEVRGTLANAYSPEIINCLVKAGADVNEYVYGTTALYNTVACVRDVTKNVECLIKHGADVNAINEKKCQTALHGICRNTTQGKGIKQERIIELLLNAGADATLLDSDHKRAIDYARRNKAINKNSKAYKKLAELSVIHTSPSDLRLIKAVRDCENLPTIKNLLAKVKDINAYDNKGMSALLYCVERNGDPEVLRLLIDAGADVNQKNKWDRWPAIVYATYYYGYNGMLPMLIKAGADVNATTGTGATALMCAAATVPINNSLKMLLDAGADIRIRDSENETVFHHLIDNALPNKSSKGANKKIDWVGALDLLLNTDRVLHLDEISEMIDYVDSKDDSRLLIEEIKDIIHDRAKEHWNRAWAKDMADKKAEILKFVRTRQPVPAKLFIQIVSDGVEPEFVKKILPFIKNINAKNEDGKTALHCSANDYGSIKMLELLIKAGANIRAKDNAGKTPYDYLNDIVWENSLEAAQKLLDPQKKA